MDISMLILSAIIAWPISVFIEFGFKYLTDIRTNLIIDKAIEKILDDTAFRQELMEHVGRIVADRINICIGATHGQER